MHCKYLITHRKSLFHWNFSAGICYLPVSMSLCPPAKFVYKSCNSDKKYIITLMYLCRFISLIVNHDVTY